jgi:dTDP-4-dehydrorhamnose 3,5-epimerase
MSGMDFRRCTIPGCYEIKPVILRDARGHFVKTWRQDAFAAAGLSFPHAEEFFTFSKRGVLRGLHLQTPPHDHWKVVCCVSGEALDAIVDLRRGSPTFGRSETVRLDGEAMTLLVLPPGIAHGFYVTGEHALLHYTVSTVHAPDHDAGIRWDSAGIAWPDPAPTLSARDAGLPPLSEFPDLFHFRAEDHAGW